MRRFAPCVLAIAACSSTDSDAPPPCQIAGTYVMTGTIESSSEGCNEVSKEGQAAAPAGGITYTISARPPGRTGPDFLLERQGLTGACPADYAGTCSIQAKCNVGIIDALDPANDIGTEQLSWTFDAAGFKGLYSSSTPAAKSLPKGCSFSANVTGARR